MRYKIALLWILLMVAPAWAEPVRVARVEDVAQPISPMPTPAAARPDAGLSNARFANTGLQQILDGLVLGQGAQGQSVARVQQALLDLGFGIPAGSTGFYGTQTVDAVRAFQRSQGLPETGRLDSPTLKALDLAAPAPGSKLWQDPRPSAAHAAPIVGGQPVRALVSLSEHRLFIYDRQGRLERVFPVASGAPGTATDTGIKRVVDRVADPSPIAWKLWPESAGGAFGTRLMDLSWYDPSTGATWCSGEELHGTYVRDSIGSYASHGCIRMFNEDIEWVYQNLRPGDLVVVRG